MTRSLLTLLLLLHYLLVGCVSVSAWAQAEPMPTRPHTYAHSHDCQLRNAWRGGQCFEDCNGTQYRVQKSPKHVPLSQLLASAKGLDLHCLPVSAGEQVSGCPRSQASRLRPGRPDAVPAGVRGRVHAPPRQQQEA